MHFVMHFGHFVMHIGVSNEPANFELLLKIEMHIHKSNFPEALFILNGTIPCLSWNELETTNEEWIY